MKNILCIAQLAAKVAATLTVFAASALWMYPI